MRVRSVVPAEVLPAGCQSHLPCGSLREVGLLQAAMLPRRAAMLQTGQAGLPFDLLYHSDAGLHLPAAQVLPAGDYRQELLLLPAAHSAAPTV